MNYSRDELVQSDATMNQMRNAIYHLERFFKNNGVTETKERFQRMGQNIAHTYIKHWKPIDKVNIGNVKDVIATIYKNVLNSSVSVEIDDVDKIIIVKDNNCALCKYHFDDINVAGCEIIAAMVGEFILLINKDSNNKSQFSLQPLDVRESRVFGNKSCIQLFKFD